MLSRLLVCMLMLPLGVAAATSNQNVVIPFELRDGFIWVKVHVARSPGPLNFLVDTGAEVSTLNVHTARQLKLNGGRRVRVAGVGAKTTGYWPQKLEATLAAVKLPSRFLVTDLCALQATSHCRIDGLLGADFFRDRIVQIDFTADEMRLLTSVPSQQRAEYIPIRLRRDIMHVPVTINGTERQWLRLDTGCASPLEWVSKPHAKIPGRARMSVGLTRFHTPAIKTTVRLGNRGFEEVHTGIHATPLFPSEQGLLGLGLLARFEQVTVDAKAGRLILSGPSR